MCIIHQWVVPQSIMVMYMLYGLWLWTFKKINLSGIAVLDFQKLVPGVTLGSGVVGVLRDMVVETVVVMATVVVVVDELWPALVVPDRPWPFSVLLSE